MDKLAQLFVIPLVCQNIFKIIDCAKFENVNSSELITRSLLLLHRSNNTTRYLPKPYSEDGRLNFTELSRKYIRPAEEYDIITEDGYVLKLFHIPGNTRRVVLFCHGILCSSDDFLLRGKTSLFYMMASKGFDVWAMNCRGNRYSRRHVILNPDTDRKFWQYSMHEIGMYDYKAVVDFILRETGVEKLSVAAHSEGTAAFFVFASQRPEYNEKINVFIALAPVTYVDNCGPGLAKLFNMSPLIIKTLKILDVEEIGGYYSETKRVIDAVCSQGMVGYELCFNILGSVTGFNPENIEQEFTSTILGHFPAGTSVKNLKHFVQGYCEKRFQQYDYYPNNDAVYGSSRPPVYDLRKVTTKVVLYAAEGDLIIGIKDVERLKTVLPNVVHYEVISDSKFNHIDYMWGRNAHLVLYQYLIEQLFKFNEDGF